MNNTSLPEILDSIEQIRKVERMIDLHKTEHDPVNSFMVKQFERLKQEFVKQLLADLMQSRINFSDMEPFFRNATSFIKKHEGGERLPQALKTNLADVERMLAV